MKILQSIISWWKRELNSIGFDLNLGIKILVTLFFMAITGVTIVSLITLMTNTTLFTIFLLISLIAIAISWIKIWPLIDKLIPPTIYHGHSYPDSVDSGMYFPTAEGRNKKTTHLRIVR